MVKSLRQVGYWNEGQQSDPIQIFDLLCMVPKQVLQLQTAHSFVYPRTWFYYIDK